MTANSGRRTSCGSFTIIIAPNWTTRRKKLWLIKTSELFKKLLVIEYLKWTILKLCRFWNDFWWIYGHWELQKKTVPSLLNVRMKVVKKNKLVSIIWNQQHNFLNVIQRVYYILSIALISFSELITLHVIFCSVN